MERNTDYNKRIYLNANIARTILKRLRGTPWRPGLAHHTSRKGEPADRERERKRLPTVLFEHTTPSTCVKQQHPGAGSPVGTHHGRPAWGRRLSGPTPWYHTAPGASLTKTLIHWPARLQRPEVGPASGRARSRCSNNWDSLFLSLSLCLQALLACLSASPLDRLSPGKTQMATGTSQLLFHWRLS